AFGASCRSSRSCAKRTRTLSSIRSGRGLRQARTYRRRSASRHAAGCDALGTNAPVLDRRAPIPDHAESRGFRASCGVDVAEVELEPDGWHLRRDGVVNDRVQELASPEDVDEIDACSGRNIDETVV